jgi:hypothetical protein
VRCALFLDSLLVYQAVEAAEGTTSPLFLERPPSYYSDYKFLAVRTSWQRINMASAIREL